MYLLATIVSVYIIGVQYAHIYIPATANSSIRNNTDAPPQSYSDTLLDMDDCVVPNEYSTSNDWEVVTL